MTPQHPTQSGTSEKERVYAELEALRSRVFNLRKEVRHLRRAGSMAENASLRLEAEEYRKALSNIAYRLDNGGVAEDDLRHIVESALALRGKKAWKRAKVAERHAKEGIDG